MHAHFDGHSPAHNRGAPATAPIGRKPGRGQPSLAIAKAAAEAANTARQNAVQEPVGNEPFRFIDLFAGIGGLRQAFEQAGGECVFTSEWDKFAQQTYKENFPDPDGKHAFAGDITTVVASDVPDHDVLVAGFPCQPFSIAGVSKKNALGRAHGFACETQGTLFFDIERIIEAKRPQAFFLENVKNLVSHDKGNTFRVIRETLHEKLGYHIAFGVLDAAWFVPQHRERIIIVGFREQPPWERFCAQAGIDVTFGGLPRFDAASLGLDRQGRPALKDVLHPQDGSETDRDDGRFLDPNGQVLPKYILTDNLWLYLQKYAEKHRAKGNGFGFSLVGPADRARTLSARYYKDGSEILISRGPGQKPRRLTPRECARLMGFPESFKIVASDTRAYKQFGNSVVVPLMAAMAKRVAEQLVPVATAQHVGL
jgi:DNA (cytosine-5)-methyltransferase 1